MTFAINFDAGVWFFTVDEVSTIDVWVIDTFTSTDFTFITVGIITAGDWDTFEFLTSATTFLTFWSLVVETHVVTDAVDFDACVFVWRVWVCVTDVATLSIAMSVDSAFEDFAFVFDTMAFTFGAIVGINFTGKGFFLAHSVTFAFDWVACLINVGTDFISSAVVVVSAVNFDTSSFLADISTRTITSCFAVIVVGTFDWFTIVVFTDIFGIKVGERITIGIDFFPAVFVFAAGLFFAFISETSVSWTKVGFTVQVGGTFNIDTFVTFFVSRADLLVTTVFSIEAIDIDTLVIATC